MNTHILSVDVEDWFHVLEWGGAEDRFGRLHWETLESRVVRNTERLLALFGEAGARATFFVLGWVAWKRPELVRRIAEAGHEIASHSFWHEVVRRHTRDSLAADLGASKRLLEDVSGHPVRGFRAPGGSITRETAWALDVLVEQGFAYDASLNPGHSSHGGFATPYPGPHRLRCNAGELLELPWSTLAVAGRRIPYAGGGYLRLLPLAALRRAIERSARAGRPTMVYVHPREVDADQPRMPLPWRRRFKYYVGLKTTEAKLRALLREHRFVPAGAWLDAHADTLSDRVFDVRAAAAAPPASPDPRLVPPRPPIPVQG